MTVAELKNWLNDFDQDAEVCIGIQQIYGSNFAYDIADVEEHIVSQFYGENEKMVVITESSQMGIVDYAGYYDEEDYE